MDDLISRQAAIDVIEKWLECSDYNEAERHIMRATESILYDLPSVNQQEPCEDAISREDIEEFKELMTDINGDVIYAVRMSDIRQLPPVNPQEKTGHWITKIKSDLRGDMWPTNPKCSECGGEPYYSNTIYNYKFCPYCGAKMVEPQESEG